ncbi:MAG: T9SS type A sorting domain-containing protein [Candidatus Cloacimonadota bacterium]|nr:T9SS type A sorting domain-containing protein [Candidatus Cloacimonadota bacterium]
MKKITFLTLLIILLFYLQAEQMYVLGELFTVENCPFCVPARSAWQDMISADDTDFFIPIMWQLSGPNPSPGAEARFDMYSEVGYTPHAEFGGRLNVIGSDGAYYHYHQNYEQIASMPSPISMEILPRIIAENQVELTVMLTTFETLAPADYRIIYLITYYDGSSYNSSVLAKTASQNLELPEVGETTQFTEELNYSGNFDIDQVKAVALVQNWDNQGITQAAQTDFFNQIDPLSTHSLEFGEVGFDDPLTLSFTITNNREHNMHGDIYSLPHFQVQSSYDIAPYSQQEIAVTFSASQAGNYAGDIILTSNLEEFATMFINVSAIVNNTNTSGEEIEKQPKLLGNYPNPFNPKTSIRFQLNNHPNAQIVIYNLKGERIRTIGNLERVSSVVWDGKDQQGNKTASGIYLYKIRGKNTPPRKMILLK